MKQYKIKASYISLCEVIIEADDYEDAMSKAKQLDGSDFEPVQGDDWNIDMIEELS